MHGRREGIRTPDTVSRIHAFQACALSHSATSPGSAHVSTAPRRRKATASGAARRRRSGQEADCCKASVDPTFRAMLRFFCRFLGTWSFAAALVVGVVDGAKSIAASGLVHRRRSAGRWRRSADRRRRGTRARPLGRSGRRWTGCWRRRSHRASCARHHAARNRTPPPTTHRPRIRNLTSTGGPYVPVRHAGQEALHAQGPRSPARPRRADSRPPTRISSTAAS